MKTENVLLVIIDEKHASGWTIEDSLIEMTELVVACQGNVVDHVVCHLDEPRAATYLTSGKVEEIEQRCHQGDVDVVIIGSELKGIQQRNLEKTFDVRTIDRTQLILDIFARRAKSAEGKLQVELAQLEYKLPRLVGKGQSMSRLGGGIGTLGPGETKLEVDRRHIKTRIIRIKRDLQEVTRTRQIKRQRRQDKQVPMISLVGYTNAGKSSLLNALTKTGTETRDGLFTTLDSLTRQVVLPQHQQVVFSDTVGFLHALPHNLIEAFKATLEEVQAADVLLHVLDVSHPNHGKYFKSVMNVLTMLDVLDKPMLLACNKVDLLDSTLLENLPIMNRVESAVMISAKTGQGLDDLLDIVGSILTGRMITVDVMLPANRMDLVNLAHEQGHVVSIDYSDKGIHLQATIPVQLSSQYSFIPK